MKQVDQTPAQPQVDAHATLPPHSHKGMLTSRLTAIGGIFALGALYTLLPENLTIGPSWLLLAIEAVLILPFGLLWMVRGPFSQRSTRIFSFMTLGLVTLALIIGVISLVVTLSTDRHATFLLGTAALLWFSNVLVFSLWYWEIDGGGPYMRHMSGHQAADFSFPQQADGNKKLWVAHFLDYLFLAFNSSTALSPTDTYPLTRPAKVLMMIQAIISLTIIVLLAGRAVNILGS